MGKHPFMAIFESIISALYRAGGRSHDGILDPSIDRPRQFQSSGLRATFFIFSAGHPHQSDAAVPVQLRSVLEPPGDIEVGKNRRRANEPYTWKLAPGFDDGIFAGIGTELFLCQLHLRLGGIVADP